MVNNKCKRIRTKGTFLKRLLELDIYKLALGLLFMTHN